MIENFTEVNRCFPQANGAGSHTGQVDGNVFRRVKLLGLTSSNGRSYPKATIQRAAALICGQLGGGFGRLVACLDGRPAFFRFPGTGVLRTK